MEHTNPIEREMLQQIVSLVHQMPQPVLFEFYKALTVNSQIFRSIAQEELRCRHKDKTLIVTPASRPTIEGVKIITKE